MAVNPNADSLGQVHRHGTARTVTRSNGSISVAQTPMQDRQLSWSPSPWPGFVPSFERKILRGGELLVWSVKNAQSVLNASDSAIHQFGCLTLISISVIGAASQKARLVTAPCTGCERAPANASCSDRWRLRGSLPHCAKDL